MIPFYKERTAMRKETDLAFQALKKRMEIMEMMTDTMKWLTGVADENEQLKKQLGDHDLTRIQLMESEREREDLTSVLDSRGKRLDMWRSATLDLADILLDLEKKGTKFTKAQQRKIAKVMKESQKHE
jgi:CRISPR/Cas system-associated protein Csm6